MFRDFKLYGFNLELTQLNGSRFDAWFLLLTLVYSVIAFNGICTNDMSDDEIEALTEGLDRLEDPLIIIK